LVLRRHRLGKGRTRWGATPPPLLNRTVVFYPIFYQIFYRTGRSDLPVIIIDP